jgi:hypothetical protein
MGNFKDEIHGPLRSNYRFQGKNVFKCQPWGVSK